MLPTITSVTRISIIKKLVFDTIDVTSLDFHAEITKFYGINRIEKRTHPLQQTYGFETTQKMHPKSNREWKMFEKWILENKKPDATLPSFQRATKVDGIFGHTQRGSHNAWLHMCKCSTGLCVGPFFLSDETDWKHLTSMHSFTSTPMRLCTKCISLHTHSNGWTVAFSPIHRSMIIYVLFLFHSFFFLPNGIQTIWCIVNNSTQKKMSKE